MSKLILLFLSFLLFIPAEVTALSPEQKKIYDSNIGYFDFKESLIAAPCGGPTSLVGSANAEKIFNFFVAKGLQPYQSAGIMGNMMAESRLNPRALQPYPGEGDQPINGRGFGLVQWTFTARQQPLVSRAQSAGVLPSDLGVQLEHVFNELSTDSHIKKGTYAKFKATQNVREATRVIEDNYEVHAGPPQPQRVSWAEDFLAKYGSSTPSGSGSVVPATGCGGSGQVVGGYSLPVDRRWYDQHPDWFSKPHHDYPAADIPVPNGSNVYSMTAGKVIKAPSGGNCGVGLVIDAGNGVTFTYCHGSDGGSIAGARQGDTVTAGQLIMHSASTGRSSGPHLHLGIELNGQNRCPQSLFTGIAKGSGPDINSLPSSGCTN